MRVSQEILIEFAIPKRAIPRCEPPLKKTLRNEWPEADEQQKPRGRRRETAMNDSNDVSEYSTFTPSLRVHPTRVEEAGKRAVMCSKRLRR